MDLKGMDVAIYLRKSRTDVDEERKAAEEGRVYDTLAKHRAELLAVAKRDSHRVLDIYEEIVSGEYIAGRLEMKKMLENIRKLKYDAVLVVDVDRLGRGDKADQGKIERIFRETQTLILTPTEMYDLNADDGEFSIEVKTFLSRMEYRQIKKRLRAGRFRSANAGREVAYRALYGYEKGEGNVLSVVEEKAKYVRLIFDWCLEGIGRIETAERLTQMGVPAPSGKEKWYHATILAMLRNPKYKGTQVYARRKFLRQEDGTYLIRPSRPDEMAMKEHAHPAIVTNAVWNAAQHVLDQRRRLPKRKDQDLINPLAGLLYCRKCGQKMQANNPSNRPNVYLSCRTADCPTKMIALNKVYSTIIEQLSDIMEALKLQTEEQSTQIAQDRIDYLLQQLNKNKLALDDIAARREKLYELLETNVYTKEVFLDRSRLMQDEESKLRAERDELTNAHRQAELKLELRENKVPTLESALSVLKKTEAIEARNRILKSIIQKVLYRREKEWTGKWQFEIEIILHD